MKDRQGMGGVEAVFVGRAEAGVGEIVAEAELPGHLEAVGGVPARVPFKSSPSPLPINPGKVPSPNSGHTSTASQRSPL